MASLQLLLLLRSPWLLEAVTGLGAAGTCRGGQASWGRQGHFEAMQQLLALWCAARQGNHEPHQGIHIFIFLKHKDYHLLVWKPLCCLATKIK